MDRVDIVLGLLAAQVSVAGPDYAGIVLTQVGKGEQRDRGGCLMTLWLNRDHHMY